MLFLIITCTLSLFTRWMDTGTDDRQLIRELLPLSRYPINDEPPTKYLRMSGNKCDTGYPHDGRADNAAYRHDRRADKRRYPHDREIDIQMLCLEIDTFKVEKYITLASKLKQNITHAGFFYLLINKIVILLKLAYL